MLLITLFHDALSAAMPSLDECHGQLFGHLLTKGAGTGSQYSNRRVTGITAELTLRGGPHE
jgi:hypothetical protein